MKRSAGRWIVITFLSLLLLLIAGLGWIVETNQGTSWALRNALNLLTVKADIKAINGSLAGGVSVDGIQISLEKWNIDIENFRLLWQLRTILIGKGAIDAVSLRGVSLEDKYAHEKTPLDITWPKPPRFLSFLNWHIRVFSVKDVTYRSDGPPEQILDELRGNVDWFLGDLIIRDLFVRIPSLTAEGSLKTSFSTPALSADLAVRPKKVAGGIDVILLKTSMRKAKEPLQMSGDMTVIAVSGKDRYAEGSGRVSLGRNDIRLDDFTVVKNGWKGRAVAAAVLDLSTVNPVMNLSVKASGMDLSKKFGIDTSVSGEVTLTSDFTNHEGRFNFDATGSSLKSAALTGTFKGDHTAIILSEIRGRMLDGTLRGSMKASLEPNPSFSGSLQVRGINPGLVAPRWEGKVNVDLDGRLTLPQQSTPEWALKAQVLDSVLRNRPFTGKVDAQWTRGALHRCDARFSGPGFSLSASGDMTERLAYTVSLNDIADFVSNSRGQISAGGWISWDKGRLAGVLTGDAKKLSIFRANVGTLRVEAQLNTDGHNMLKGTVRAKTVVYGGLNADSVSVTAMGALDRHDITIAVNGKKETITAAFSGGYAGKVWQGMCTQMRASDYRFGSFTLTRPVPVKASPARITVDPFVLSGPDHEELRFEIDVGLSPVQGSLKAQWVALNIGRLQNLVTEGQFAGRTSGSLVVEWPLDRGQHMAAEATFSDVVLMKTSAPRIPAASIKMKWDGTGLLGSWEVMVGDKGKLEGGIWSKEKAFFGIPRSAHFRTAWNAVNIDMFKPFLPATLDLRGSLSGKIDGLLLPEAHVELEGRARLSESRLSWKDGKGEASIKSDNIDLDFAWREGMIKGALSVALSSRNRLTATYRIPLPARFPLRMDPRGPVEIAAAGEIVEMGLLGAFFPGLLEQSEGNMNFNLLMTGVWDKPVFQGKMVLSGASAYLYAAGLHLKDIGAEVVFQKDRIDVTSFSLRSGQGTLRGSGGLQLEDWRLTRYEGKVQGKGVQVVYLPDLQVSADPDLHFEGDLHKTKIRGSVLISDCLIQQVAATNVVSASPDVVITDTRTKKKGTPSIAFDAEVNVALGDKVFVNAQGIEAKLAGNALLAFQNIDNILAKGQVSVEKGRYRGYGIDLAIDRGRIIFSNVPVDLGALDILAVRKIRTPKEFNDIRAGVTITGTIRTPQVKLYSEPAMSEADIISYTLFGKPMGKGDKTAQAAYILRAAGMLLSKDEAGSLQDQVGKVLGIDTIEIETVEGKKDTLADSVVTVGKYLSPELYVAFGRSLFSGENVITTRYSFMKNWHIEGIKKGVDTGADIYYRIEFR